MGTRAFVDKRLKVLYEDSDIVVVIAPHEDELENIVSEILKTHPDGLTVKDIHKYLEAVASEEKIRKTLYKLVAKQLVKSYTDGRYEWIGKTD